MLIFASFVNKLRQLSYSSNWPIDWINRIQFVAGAGPRSPNLLWSPPRLVDWLWWGKTDVSELRPLRAFCSSPGDLWCGPWMMILTWANSQLVYQSALAAPSTAGSTVSRDTSVAIPTTGWFPVSRDICVSHQYCLVSCHPRRLWSEWEVGKDENLVYLSPCNFKRYFKGKGKAVPLHAMEALGGRGRIAPTHSRPRH
jgi:hypothetical protein